MSAPPLTISNFIMFSKSDGECSNLDAKKGRWFWFAICYYKIANKIDCEFTIGRWNEHKKQTRHVTDLTNNNAVDDLKNRESPG